MKVKITKVKEDYGDNGITLICYFKVLDRNGEERVHYVYVNPIIQKYYNKNDKQHFEVGKYIHVFPFNEKLYSIKGVCY